MLCASVLLILAALAHADVVLVPEAVSVAGGATVSVTVMVTNTGKKPITWTVEKSLSARLHSGSARSEDVVLTTDAPEGGRIIPPGGYVQLPYRFQLRPGLFGPVVLELRQLESKPVMFSILDGEDAARASVGVAELPANDPKTVAHETALRRSTELLPGLSRYEPVYFGVGGNGGLNAKFQVSLKYQPFDLVPFYFSYSQTSLWDLHDSSAPFHDTSYRPRLFLQEEQLWVSQSKKAWLGLESGFGHESNGQGGSQSRSINILYVRPRLDWVAPGDYHVFISPMIYGYLDKSENPDIAAYRGYADVLIGVNKNGWRLSTTLRKGAKAHFGSIEVNAVLPLRSSDRFFDRIGARGLNGYWFVQYFNGWGETILDYNLKFRAQFRTGLMLVP
jgi:outer membrane phospholipase A